MRFQTLVTIAAMGMLVIGVSGCATTDNVPAQEITVHTVPEGAHCTFMRKGAVVARLNPAPGVASVKPAKDDLTIICSKQGYKEASYLNHPHAVETPPQDTSLGDKLGRQIGLAPQTTSRYEDAVNLKLSPADLPTPKPSAPVTPPAPPDKPVDLPPGQGPA